MTLETSEQSSLNLKEDSGKTSLFFFLIKDRGQTRENAVHLFCVQQTKDFSFSGLMFIKISHCYNAPVSFHYHEQ